MRSIRDRLLVLFVSSTALLLLVVGLASYQWTLRVAERKVSESTVLTLSQIDRNLATMYGAVRDISLFLIANRNVQSFLKFDRLGDRFDATDAKIVAVREALNDDLSNLVASKSFILSVNLYGFNGPAYESVGPSSVDPRRARSFAEALPPPTGELVRSGTYERYYQSLGDRRVISFYRTLRDPNRLNRALGTMRIDLDEGAVAEGLAERGPQSQAYAFACDGDGSILSHPNPTLIGSRASQDPVFSDAFASPSGYYRAKVAGLDSLVTHFRSERGVLVSVRPFNELVSDAGEIRLFSVALFLVSSFLAAASAWWIAVTITTPIKALAEGMRKVESGDFGALVAVSGNDEIGRLGRSFNSMSRHIRQLIDEVYTIELVKKEAELKALQAQINPHFLYNTLDVIYWTARLEGATKTSEAVHSLSRLFRLGLNQGEELTTLGKELEHLRCYLEIQALRYDEPPLIEFSIQEGLESCVTTKLLLQPLVENAFLHGIADSDRPPRIGVTARRVGEGVELSVEDNGVGMDKALLSRVLAEDLSGKKGYGLRNVDQAIKLAFGEEYGLSIESQPDWGTLVLIRIPWRIEHA